VPFMDENEMAIQERIMEEDSSEKGSDNNAN
jgi:hypothetical protein